MVDAASMPARIERSAAAAELRARLKAELLRRQDTREFKAAVRAKILECGRTDTPPMAPQRKVLEDKARLLLLCCSRRAGKSEVLSRMIADALLGCSHGEWVVFGARTLGIAKDIIWAELSVLDAKYCLGWSINNSDLSIATQSGGRFRLFGVDDRKSVDKVRGKKYRLVICDEASTYDEHLRELVEVAFDPGTKDLDGRIVLSGTPGYVKVGYWYEASQGIVRGWSCHHWTIRDNTHIADVEAKLAETREMFGWDDDHPTYVCEYLGVWADNSTLLVCDYNDARNGIDELPDDYSLSWRHVIGIDFGSVDATAWVVLAVNPFTDERYVVYSFSQSGLLGDEPVEITRELVERFKTTYVVSDPAGGGLPFYKTFNAKHGQSMGCVIRSANKTDLLGRIRMFNAELRTGRLKFLRREAAGVIAETRRLLWKDERKNVIVEGKAFPMDNWDALLYACMEVISWKSRDKPPDSGPVETNPALIAAEKARKERARIAQRKTHGSWFER